MDVAVITSLLLQEIFPVSPADFNIHQKGQINAKNIKTYIIMS